jgi:hypothetical protein
VSQFVAKFCLLNIITERFHPVILAYAAESGWLELAHDAMARVSFMLLTGSIPIALTLPPEQALDIIDTTIHWNSRIRDSPDWVPAKGMIPLSLFSFRCEG